ncbi:HNH endonuclease [Pedobacter sp. MW01-1-1]|uniref:HNH endonuclease n=1 Tax=Pedobacter sp. MW01-1-1 TaxID=3383027 RepID=UPI003FEDCB5C
MSKKYPNGVSFNKLGFPDFSPYARTTVDLKTLGKSTATDINAANKMAGYPETPKNFTWHHVENSTKLELIPTDLHNAVKHTGGRATNAP